jgi:hypothetical protein
MTELAVLAEQLLQRGDARRRVRLVVLGVQGELVLLAGDVDAALGVDLVDGQLDRLVLQDAERRGRPRQGFQVADRDRSAAASASASGAGARARAAAAVAASSGDQDAADRGQQAHHALHLVYLSRVRATGVQPAASGAVALDKDPAPT